MQTWMHSCNDDWITTTVLWWNEIKEIAVSSRLHSVWDKQTDVWKWTSFSLRSGNLFNAATTNLWLWLVTWGGFNPQEEQQDPQTEVSVLSNIEWRCELWLLSVRSKLHADGAVYHQHSVYSHTYDLYQDLTKYPPHPHPTPPSTTKTMTLPFHSGSSSSMQPMSDFAPLLCFSTTWAPAPGSQNWFLS